MVSEYIMFYSSKSDSSISIGRLGLVLSLEISNFHWHYIQLILPFCHIKSSSLKDRLQDKRFLGSVTFKNDEEEHKYSSSSNTLSILECK